MHLLWGGTPENGITAQENAETATTIPTTGMKITKGGDYEIKGDTYTGGITVNASDNDEVTIHIASNVKFTRDNQVFIWVENAKLVTIENTDNHTVTLNGQHFYDLSTASNGVESVINGGTYIAPGRNMIMVQGTNNTLTLNNVNIQTNTGYAVTTDSNTVYVNGGTFTKTSSLYSEFKNQGHLTLTDVTVTPQVAVDGKTSTIVENYTGAVVEINGGNYKTTNQSCIVNNGTVTINNGTLESEGASCIQNNWGRVEINGGTITSDAESTIRNRGTLRMTDGTVTNTNAAGAAIDISGNFGDIKLIGGTIKGGKDGIRLENLGSSVVTLKQATFEGNANNVHLGDGQKIDIERNFTGTATILTDDPSVGRQITLKNENEDLSYQNKLKLISVDPHYIIGYKRGDDGKEYRYLANSNGKTVNAVNAKATADLGAEEQELDTATVVPENTTVTVTANLPEGAEGAEFLGWSAVRDDGKALDWTPARDDPQTITFTMPDCNVTVEALYRGGNGDIDNPSGGGSSDAVAGIAAVALTGAAAWGIYEAGTGIYRVLNMPGVPMPSNRAGLATLIWEKAGCPEPQTVKSFSDIDDTDLHLRQAASWMEEQGLMDDVKENEFRPYRYVTKLQTCLVWDKAKEKSLIS